MDQAPVDMKLTMDLKRIIAPLELTWAKIMVTSMDQASWHEMTMDLKDHSPELGGEIMVNFNGPSTSWHEIDDGFEKHAPLN
jgi:hypothetical protein